MVVGKSRREVAWQAETDSAGYLGWTWTKLLDPVLVSKTEN